MDVLKQFVKAGFSVYFALTRIAQVVLAVIILGLDAFVIAEYDKLTSPNPNVNSVDLTSIFGGGDGYDIDIDDAIDDIIGNIRRRQFGGWDIPDFPGNTPFKAFVMFTVSPNCRLSSDSILPLSTSAIICSLVLLLTRKFSTDNLYSDRCRLRGCIWLDLEIAHQQDVSYLWRDCPGIHPRHFLAYLLRWSCAACYYGLVRGRWVAWAGLV
jgi:hypothetical protein